MTVLDAPAQQGTESAAVAALSALQLEALGRSLRQVGYVQLDQFISTARVERIRSAIEAHVANAEVIAVDRSNLLGHQRFLTINGAEAFALPELARLLESVRELVSTLCGRAYEPVHVPEIALSVNVVGQGDSFSPHYDRHELTAILYLNEPRGGEFYMWPRYRRLWPGRRRRPMRWLQHVTDLATFFAPMRALLGKRVSVAPRPGRLLVMWGWRTLHGVAPVHAGESRYSVQFAYDRPGVRYKPEAVAGYYGHGRKGRR